MTDQPQHPPDPQQPRAQETWPTQAPAYGPPSAYAGPPAYAFRPPWGPLAGWGARVVAMLVDCLLSLVGLIPYVVGIVLVRRRPP